MAKLYTVFYTHDLMSIYRGIERFDETLFEHVATVSADDLEHLFRKMNVVDGDELPIELGVRSMSCGDVALDCATGQLWLCDLAGWKEVST